MIINTSRFGSIEIDDSSIILFADGLLGFEDLKKFAIVSCEETLPIHWLQSIDKENIALPIISPFIIKKDYDVEVDDCELDVIKTTNEEEIVVYCVAVLPQDISKITVNLAAPILINYVLGLGKQAVMGVIDDTFIRYSAFESLLEYYREVSADAGSDEKVK